MKRFHPLCFRAQRHTGNLHKIGFLLQSTGICENLTGSAGQKQHFQISHRIDQLDIAETFAGDRLFRKSPCAGMDRNDNALRKLPELSESLDKLDLDKFASQIQLTSLPSWAETLLKAVRAAKATVSSFFCPFIFLYLYNLFALVCFDDAKLPRLLKNRNTQKWANPEGGG